MLPRISPFLAGSQSAQFPTRRFPKLESRCGRHIARRPSVFSEWSRVSYFVRHVTTHTTVDWSFGPGLDSGVWRLRTFTVDELLPGAQPQYAGIVRSDYGALSFSFDLGVVSWRIRHSELIFFGRGRYKALAPLRFWVIFSFHLSEVDGLVILVLEHFTMSKTCSVFVSIYVFIKCQQLPYKPQNPRLAGIAILSRQA